MNYRYCFLVTGLSITLSLWHIASARNISKGTLITPESIPLFIEPLPADAAHVIEWIQEHASTLKFLAATPKPLSSWEDKKARGNKCLKKNRLKNLGSNNYVFKIPNSDWIVKISGPLRRLVNLYVYSTGSDPYVPAEYKRHKAFSNKHLLNTLAIVPTYVTISRFANALLCKEVSDAKKITRVHFPEIYLVHIPGCPTEISDDNYIIVEKEKGSIENICAHTREQKALTKKVIRELYTIITQCGMFDFNGENVQIDAKNNVVFIDLEQGMVENPAHFFNKDKEMFDYRVYEGLTSFAETHLAQFPEKYSYFRSLIQKDRSLRGSDEWENIEEYFSLNFRKKGIIAADAIDTFEEQTNIRALDNA